MKTNNYNGFAITPKVCKMCGKTFVFEKYIKIYNVIAPSCSGYDYYCKKCSNEIEACVKTYKEVKEN